MSESSKEHGQLNLSPPATTRRSLTIPGGHRGNGRMRLLLLDGPTSARRGKRPQRPRTRADCKGTEVCPWVSCKWHLMLDVNPATGAIKINYPDVPLDELPATCALELIDRAPGGMTLDEIGVALNLTRERVRQIVRVAKAQIGPLTEALAEDE